MPDTSPLIMERVSGTPGTPDATGLIRRVTAAELEAYGQTALDWMPKEAVLGRQAGAVTSIVIPPSSVLGRAASGSVRPLLSADLDAILGLSALIGGRAPAIHSHAISAITNLQTELNARALLLHEHNPNQIRSTNIPVGYVLTRGVSGGEWAAPTGGGGATLAGPLVGDIEMGTFRILGCSPAVEFFRCTGGRLIVQGGRLPILNEGTPATGHVWIWTGSAWVHRTLLAADITATALTGVPGTTVHAQLEQLLALIEARALTAHTHALADLLVPGGATVGQVISVGSGGTFVVTTPSGGGGGIANPLTANLDIATFALMSGAQEILKWAGGKVVLGGRDVIPAAITSPAAGHVAVYNDGTTVFENRILTAAEVSVSAISGLSGATVQAALASLESTKLETSATTDAVAPGANAARQYANATSVAAAGAVMVSALATSTSLGTSNVLAPSQNAVKVYVDTAIAASSGGGVPVGSSFAVSPDDGDVFAHTGMLELFIFVAAESAWIGLSERSVSFALEDYAPAKTTGSTTSPGAYIFGSGNTLGYRLPFDAFITGAVVQSSTVDSGTIEVRKAPYGGTVTAALELEFTADAGASLMDEFVAADEGDLLSVHAADFGDGILGATMTLFYRRRVAA